MGNKPTKSSRTITSSASDSYNQQQLDSANSGGSENFRGSASASYGYGQQFDASYGQQQLDYGNFRGSENFRGSTSASNLSYGQQQTDSADFWSLENLWFPGVPASTSYGQQRDAYYGQQQLDSENYGGSVSASYRQPHDLYGEQLIASANFWGLENYWVPEDSVSASSASASTSYGQQLDSSASFGCQHYRRKCMIKAPCCDQVFQCRQCHDEAMNSLAVDPTHRHELPRHQVQRVICCLCNTEQKARQYCKKCGVCMGKYFCAECKLFDDDVSKQQYHCDGCGICRTGGQHNFFHCDTCGGCFSKNGQHMCVENVVHNDCPICYEDLFNSTTKNATQLPCGHMMHLECKIEMEQHSYKCPICSRSIYDMSETWRQYDQEAAQSSQPEDSFWSILGDFHNVRILCNDCRE